jgi:diphthamide synthase subunit DPH2
MKHIHTFEGFLTENLNEGKSNGTMEILDKIKEVASQLGFSAFTTLDSLKIATKGTVLEPSVKKYKSSVINAAYLLIDGSGYHLLVIMPSEQNSGEIDIYFYKMIKAEYSSGASMDHFYGNKESKTWTYKKTWKEWFTL